MGSVSADLGESGGRNSVWVGSGRTEPWARVRGKTVQGRGSGGGLVGGTLLREGLQLGGPRPGRGPRLTKN